MDQRRVRLGDIVDDYCPRERRLTNHAVVAMIEDEIRLTRCTTCDAEHPYKSARIPRRRKKTEHEPDTPGTALPAGPDGGDTTANGAESAFDAHQAAESDSASGADDPQPMIESDGAAMLPDGTAVPETAEDGPVRRPLIRATLPRPEGQPTARPLPEFTVRQPGVRGGGGSRQGDFRGPRDGRQSVNGNRQVGGHARHGRSGSGHGRQGGGSHRGSSRQEHQGGHKRPGRPAPHARGGKKRSR